MSRFVVDPASYMREFDITGVDLRARHAEAMARVAGGAGMWWIVTASEFALANGVNELNPAPIRAALAAGR